MVFVFWNLIDIEPVYYPEYQEKNCQMSNIKKARITLIVGRLGHLSSPFSTKTINPFKPLKTMVYFIIKYTSGFILDIVCRNISCDELSRHECVNI